MSDDRARPFDGLSQWLGDSSDDGTEPAGPSDSSSRRRRPVRRTARAAALVAPWLAAGAVLVASAAPTVTTPRTSPVTTRTGPPAMAPAVPTPADRPATSGDAPALASTPEAPERAARAGAGAVTVPAGAAAVAVRLVRDAVTGRHVDASAAVDVAVAEQPRPLGHDQWLVRVQAVVLRGDTRRWRSASHETWAVPVGVRDGRPVGLDDPWPVATEDPTIARAPWDTADVDERAVRSAVRAIGARAAPDLAAERHPTIAHVVRVRVVAAGRIRHLWLTTRPTPRVLGAPVTAAAAAQRATP